MLFGGKSVIILFNYNVVFMKDLFTEQERLDRSYSIKTFWHAVFGSLAIYAFLAFLVYYSGWGYEQSEGIFYVSLGVSSWWYFHLKHENNRLLHVRVQKSKRYVFMRDVTIGISFVAFVVFLVFWYLNLSDGFWGVLGDIISLILRLTMYGMLGVCSCYFWGMVRILPIVNDYIAF